VRRVKIADRGRNGIREALNEVEARIRDEPELWTNEQAAYSKVSKETNQVGRGGKDKMVSNPTNNMQAGRQPMTDTEQTASLTEILCIRESNSSHTVAETSERS
jgi:hypothetical protein